MADAVVAQVQLLQGEQRQRRSQSRCAFVAHSARSEVEGGEARQSLNGRA